MASQLKYTNSNLRHVLYLLVEYKTGHFCVFNNNNLRRGMNTQII